MHAFIKVKWSGAYQDGAGLTLGEEVEQCNAFLSRIAVTTKHMSKAGEKAKYCFTYIKSSPMNENDNIVGFCLQDGQTC